MTLKHSTIHYWLYSEIKKRSNGDLMKSGDLYKIIAEKILMKKGCGGDKRKGVPRQYLFMIVKELRELNLIKRLNHKQFQILKSDCKKKLRNFPY